MATVIGNEVCESWYTQWHEPDEFISKVCTAHSIVGNLEIWRPKNRPLLDAWIAGEFTAIRNTFERCKVRLIRDDFPDFEVQLEHGEERFEATEADKNGRRRGDEFREAEEKRRSGQSPARDAEYDQLRTYAISAITRAIARKVNKCYSEKVNLIVYVNIFQFFCEPLSVEMIRTITEPGREHFTSIWLLWNTKAIRAWPQYRCIGSPRSSSASPAMPR